MPADDDTNVCRSLRSKDIKDCFANARQSVFKDFFSYTAMQIQISLHRVINGTSSIHCIPIDPSIAESRTKKPRIIQFVASSNPVKLL